MNMSQSMQTKIAPPQKNIPILQGVAIKNELNFYKENLYYYFFVF